MILVNWRAEGGEALARKWATAPTHVRERLLTALEYIGGELQARMMSLEAAQLQRQSGKLYRAFFHKVHIRGTEMVLNTGVARRAFYGAFHEKGVDAVEGDVRRYRGRRGKRVSKTKKRTVKLRARPFIRPAFDSMRAQIIETLRIAVKQGVDIGP